MAECAAKASWGHLSHQGRGYTNKHTHKHIETSSSQDILSYLSVYLESPPCTADTETLTTHPVDVVLEAFKDAAIAESTMKKLHCFLEEVMKVHGKKADFASLPVPW